MKFESNFSTGVNQEPPHLIPDAEPQAEHDGGGAVAKEMLDLLVSFRLHNRTTGYDEIVFKCAHEMY